MNLVHLQSFYHVARLGGFSAAAEALDVSKGLVSRHVTALEKALGAQLLHRTTRRVSLTEAGQQLYGRAEQIQLLSSQAQCEVSTLTSDSGGLLRFTAPISLGHRLTTDLIPAFQRRCPEVKLELNFTSTAMDIEHGDQDIALRSFAELSDNLVAHHLGTLRNQLVVSSDYLSFHGSPTTPQQMVEHNCILNSHQQAWNEWNLERDGVQHRVNVQGTISAKQYSTAKTLALMGVGIANLPLEVIEMELNRGELQPILEDYQVAMHPISIVYAKHRVLPKKLRIFRDLLVQWFNDHPHFLIAR